MTNDTASKTRPPADGTWEEIDGKHVLRFERRLAHPVERVWAALTEPEQLVQWLAHAEQLDLVEGGRIVLRWKSEISAEEIEKYDIDMPPERGDGPTVLHGTITRVDPPRLLEWEGDIHGILRWELREQDPGCVLTFTSTLPPLETPMATQALAGWHWHLDALEAALAGHPVDPSLDEWSAIRERYAAMLT
jgi:uncharacterized protein YndB with AHSA1/START domain